MNEENEWDHKISAEVKAGPADCIRMDEVTAALKEMKRHKAAGLSGLVTEMIQATGEIGTQWILDLCNGIIFSSFISFSMYSFHESLIPLSSTITFFDAPFVQFNPVISCLSLTICFAIRKISF